MVPLVRWAYNQLKMKVRALPTWRNPVGEGAKRTRGLPAKELASGIGQVGLSMVRGGKKHRQAESVENGMQPPDFIRLERWHVLKTY